MNLTEQSPFHSIYCYERVIYIPTIYLSPSTQEFNPYVNGGNEEQYMNLIADAMIPYLDASGISYVRNTPDMTAASSIAASNRGNYDLHLALHSNASSDGSAMGTEAYYYPYSNRGQRLAEIIANNFKMIYPYPNLVETVPTTTLGEVRRTKAPSVLLEVAYHDNPEDADWIKANINNIAKNIVISLTDYFNIPFNEPMNLSRRGRVTTMGANLNLRERPDIYSRIIGKIPNGSIVEILSMVGNWYLVRYNSQTGYASGDYIVMNGR